jgi:uncharacterized membrane protein
MHHGLILLLAHEAGGYGNNPFLTPWEIHPILIHFPIAFFFGGLLLDLYAWARGRLDLARVATGMYVGGVVMGLLTALAGALAFFTLPPTHTEQAHGLMYWHLALEAASVTLFLLIAWVRWRRWEQVPSTGLRFFSLLAIGLFVFASALGGYIVYHGGTGIPTEVFTAHEKQEGHEHHAGGEHAGHGPETNAGHLHEEAE